MISAAIHGAIASQGSLANILPVASVTAFYRRGINIVESGGKLSTWTDTENGDVATPVGAGDSTFATVDSNGSIQTTGSHAGINFTASWPSTMRCAVCYSNDDTAGQLFWGNSSFIYGGRFEDGSSSTDTKGIIATYSWTFGEDSFNYANEGTFILDTLHTTIVDNSVFTFTTSGYTPTKFMFAGNNAFWSWKLRIHAVMFYTSSSDDAEARSIVNRFLI